MISDDKIETKHHAEMNAIAAVLDRSFNGDATGTDKKVCFVLLVAPFGDTEGRVNYISNGRRQDIVTLLKEITARFEGQPEMKGRA